MAQNITTVLYLTILRVRNSGRVQLSSSVPRGVNRGHKTIFNRQIQCSLEGPKQLANISHALARTLWHGSARVSYLVAQDTQNTPRNRKQKPPVY